MTLTLEQVSPLMQAALASGLRVRMVVHGQSMRPFIFDGDQVELASCEGRMPLHGQTVLVRRDGGSWVLHRVTRAGDNGLYLRGDAQVFEEGPFAPHQVVARATGIVRNHRVVPLDRGIQRWAGRLWHAALPFRLLLVPGLLVARRLLIHRSTFHLTERG